MTYGPTLGALLTTSFARSAPQRHPGRPSRRGRVASRTVAVCTALALVVTLAFAAGLASGAVAKPARVAPPPDVVNAATADQPLPGPHLSGLRGSADGAATPGPHLSGLRGSADIAAAPSEEGGFPWGAAAIGTGVALGLLGLVGLAISRARSRTRTGPAVVSQ